MWFLNRVVRRMDDGFLLDTFLDADDVSMIHRSSTLSTMTETLFLLYLFLLIGNDLSHQIDKFHTFLFSRNVTNDPSNMTMSKNEWKIDFYTRFLEKTNRKTVCCVSWLVSENKLPQNVSAFSHNRAIMFNNNKRHTQERAGSNQRDREPKTKSKQTARNWFLF